MKKCDAEKVRIADYNYTLPQEKIAKYPLPKRDASKLLLFCNNQISTLAFSSIAEEIPEGSLMIFNDTGICLADLRKSPTTRIFSNFQQRRGCSWHCMTATQNGGRMRCRRCESFMRGRSCCSPEIAKNGRYGG